MQELLEMVRQSQVNCIIVKDFSRFGRNSIKVGYFMERVFPIYGIRFISLNDEYDSSKYHEDSAVEDGLPTINPVKSKRLVINTHKGSHHKAIPPAKMMWVREHVHILPTREKRIVALLSYTGMRLEEVLGVCWNDFDFHAKRICICRAVIHPTRNQPEVKLPKTAAGNRVIPLPDKLIELLEPLEQEGFILGGSKPLSYQQQKLAFDRIRKTFGLEDYSAHDFRDTCATEWREAGMSIETISKMLGHANSTVTEKCYVKFREKSLDEARGVMNLI